MQTKHLFVMIHIRKEAEVGIFALSNMFKHSSKKKFTTRSKQYMHLFCGSFLLFVFHVRHAFLSVPCSLVDEIFVFLEMLRFLFLSS